MNTDNSNTQEAEVEIISLRSTGPQFLERGGGGEKQKREYDNKDCVHEL